MTDAHETGYSSGGYSGERMGGSCGPGCTMTLMERLCNSLGKTVTVYVGSSTSVTGTLQGVGSDYVEVYRTVNSTNDSMLVPLHAITAVSVPG